MVVWASAAIITSKLSRNLFSAAISAPAGYLVMTLLETGRLNIFGAAITSVISFDWLLQSGPGKTPTDRELRSVYLHEVWTVSITAGKRKTEFLPLGIMVVIMMSVLGGSLGQDGGIDGFPRK